VYLAGPEVFLPNAAELSAAKLKILDASGLEGRCPYRAIEALELLDEIGAVDHVAPADRGYVFFQSLAAILDESDALIANMTPFRGPSADVGTAWEMGYAAARDLPVFAYTNRIEHYGERVELDGLLIESFDLSDNLMLEGCVRRSGNQVERHDSRLPGARGIEVLDGFERCVRRAAAVLLG